MRNFIKLRGERKNCLKILKEAKKRLVTYGWSPAPYDNDNILGGCLYGYLLNSYNLPFDIHFFIKKRRVHFFIKKGRKIINTIEWNNKPFRTKKEVIRLLNYSILHYLFFCFPFFFWKEKIVFFLYLKRKKYFCCI